MAIKIGINGFGRIGRVVFRRAILNSNIEITQINDLADGQTLKHLLQYDSVHGPIDQYFPSPPSLSVTDDQLILNDKACKLTQIKDPREIKWENTDIVFECTGLFRTKEKASWHMQNSDVKKVIVSAPAQDEDLTVVMGVNEDKLEADHHIISNGSCTTNCLAPVIKPIYDQLGISSALMTTIHSYTNDQHILDLPHKDLRRARAAALNMIPTSTGAAKAIGLVIPELAGKVQGLAVRVPTPNVSLVDVSMHVRKQTTKEEVNKILKEASSTTLTGILGYTEEPLVSTDFNGSPLSSIVDADSTLVTEGTFVKVLSWYDNETGFSQRMLDLASFISQRFL